MVALALSAPTGRGNKAKDLLQSSFTKAYTTPVSGIFQQTAPGRGSDCSTLMKVEQSKLGKTKMSILQPLSQQGVTSVDDGEVWVTYLPDQRRLISQGSPRKRIGDASSRLDIAERNYSLAIRDGETIAGRKTTCVEALPKFKEMHARRYYLDVDTDYLLRLETISPLGVKSLALDTRYVSFPQVLPASLFKLQPMGDVRRIELPGPQPLDANGRAILGFDPIQPQNLPFGFVVTQQQLVGERDKKFAAVRLSDGFVDATVYQWDAKGKSPFPKSGREREVRGIRIRLVGELPENVLFRLLEQFIKETMGLLSSQLETIQARILFQYPEDVVEGEPHTNSSEPRRFVVYFLPTKP